MEEGEPSLTDGKVELSPVVQHKLLKWAGCTTDILFRAFDRCCINLTFKETNFQLGFNFLLSIVLPRGLLLCRVIRQYSYSELCFHGIYRLTVRCVFTFLLCLLVGYMLTSMAWTSPSCESGKAIATLSCSPILLLLLDQLWASSCFGKVKENSIPFQFIVKPLLPSCCSCHILLLLVLSYLKLICL